MEHGELGPRLLNFCTRTSKMSLLVDLMYDKVVFLFREESFLFFGRKA